MSQDRHYSHSVSLKLSEVFSDLGVTEKMVLKKRRMFLLNETMMTTTNRLLGVPLSCYHFGSQTEGSTTVGLESDLDTLHYFTCTNVIQDWSEWQPGENLLIIQDENTSPGYCLLQCLRHDEPLPSTMYSHVPVLDSLFTVRGGRMLQKNTVHKIVNVGLVINGPALSSQQTPGCIDQDHVFAYHCKSWPAEARPWLVRQGIGGWPTEEMKRYCETTGCFVVPVSSKSGQYQEIEWRISTSQAERYLMFSLNLTQIRCYILMKMILKTFINPQCAGVLSSFMCKTILFCCIQNTRSNEWQEQNLLACLKCCLLALQNYVRQGNCPHFIIPGNNLMAGKISASNKHKLLGILQVIATSDGQALLEIPIDSLGFRLNSKMNRLHVHVPFLPAEATMKSRLQAIFLLNSGKSINQNHNLLLNSIQFSRSNIVQQKLSEYISTLSRIYRETDLNCLENLTCRLLTPPLCSLLGSVIASNDIYTNNSLSATALDWFSAGLNSDVTSGRLKLASALYCVGDINSTEFVLRNTEDLYDLVEPVCFCYNFQHSCPRPEVCDKSNTGNEQLIKQVTAACVKFVQCEINCIPQELQYEMFRSTPEEMHRRTMHDYWMDWAVVDSLPYLYFLQYKTYGCLQRAAGQQCALTYLFTTIETEPNLGHRETALNLLGQCMEQENRPMDALHCYMKSLNVRARHNAAKIHICRLLNVLINRQVR